MAHNEKGLNLVTAYVGMNVFAALAFLSDMRFPYSALMVRQLEKSILTRPRPKRAESLTSNLDQPQIYVISRSERGRM